MKILYFANIRQTIGIIEEKIEIDGTFTVEDVIKILVKKNEKYKKAFSNIDNIKCSINLNYVKLNAKVKNSDELAFFPPVTGG